MPRSISRPTVLVPVRRCRSQRLYRIDPGNCRRSIQRRFPDNRTHPNRLATACPLAMYGSWPTPASRRTLAETADRIQKSTQSPCLPDRGIPIRLPLAGDILFDPNNRDQAENPHGSCQSPDSTSRFRECLPARLASGSIVRHRSNRLDWLGSCRVGFVPSSIGNLDGISRTVPRWLLWLQRQ